MSKSAPYHHRILEALGGLNVSLVELSPVGNEHQAMAFFSFRLSLSSFTVRNADGEHVQPIVILPNSATNPGCFASRHTPSPHLFSVSRTDQYQTEGCFNGLSLETQINPTLYRACQNLDARDVPVVLTNPLADAQARFPQIVCAIVDALVRQFSGSGSRVVVSKDSFKIPEPTFSGKSPQFLQVHMEQHVNIWLVPSGGVVELI